MQFVISWSITLKIELWAPYTHWHAVLKGEVILRQKAKFGPDYCKHTFVAKTISDMSETLTLDVSEKDKIFVVQENPYFP